jgi:outer membrane protein assembly factor BamB
VRGVLVQERCCPACRETVRGRDARWCGTCGELLEPVAVEAPSPTRSPWRHRLLIGTVGAAILAVAVVTGGGVIDRTAARSAAVQDLAVATPDADVLDGLEPAPRPAPPVVEEPTCTRTGDRACFLWSVQVDGVEHSPATIASGLLFTQDASRPAWIARDVRDGTVVWSAEVATGFGQDSMLLAAGDLALHVDGDAWVARELATGVERWRTEQLGSVTPWQVALRDDVLVAIGDDQAASEELIEDGHALAAGLDPTTGSLLWQQEGVSASLAAGGVTVVATEDGDVAAYRPSGELGWRRQLFDDGSSAHAWAHGHLVSVYDEDTDAASLHRLVDGEPLGYDGRPVATSEEHTLVHVESSPRGLVLLDEAGEVWRADLFDGSDCLFGGRFASTTIEFTTCSGGQVTLDRSDGSLLERMPGSEAAAPTPGSEAEALPFQGYREFVGPYELRSSETGGSVQGAIVTDAATGAELARLPPETWSVWQQDRDRAGSEDVLVLQSRGWLTALPLPRPSVVGGVRRQ